MIQWFGLSSISGMLIWVNPPPWQHKNAHYSFPHRVHHRNFFTHFRHLQWEYFGNRGYLRASHHSLYYLTLWYSLLRLFLRQNLFTVSYEHAGIFFRMIFYHWVFLLFSFEILPQYTGYSRSYTSDSRVRHNLYTHDSLWDSSRTIYPMSSWYIDYRIYYEKYSLNHSYRYSNNLYRREKNYKHYEYYRNKEHYTRHPQQRTRRQN